jgi:Squalene-hopene cyclase C-terminal domain
LFKFAPDPQPIRKFSEERFSMAGYLTKARELAILRGMFFIYGISCQPRHFAKCADDLLYFFYHVGRTARDTTLRRMSRDMARESFSRWQNSQQTLPSNPDPDTIIDYFHAGSTAEQFGVRNPALKRQIRQAISRFTAGDFLWFDPHREAPAEDVPESCDYCESWNARGRKRCIHCRRRLTMMTRYQVWYYSLIRTYCAHVYGIALGAAYEDVFKWLSALHPYRGRDGGANPDFADSIYAISHVVYTLNDYGSFLLSPDWLPQEFAFLRDNVKEAVALDDPDMTGEMLDSLMAFGLTDQDKVMREGIDYLLERQNPDGSWGDVKSRDLYCRYHPTWSAIDGLREFDWRGRRLLFPQVLPLLKSWANGKGTA